MNGYGLQDLGVAALAVAALGWLVWRNLRVRRGKAKAACPDCPVAKPVEGVRPAPMPKIRPTEAGEAALRARRQPLISISGLKPRG